MTTEHDLSYEHLKTSCGKFMPPTPDGRMLVWDAWIAAEMIAAERSAAAREEALEEAAQVVGALADEWRSLIRRYADKNDPETKDFASGEAINRIYQCSARHAACVEALQKIRALKRAPAASEPEPSFVAELPSERDNAIALVRERRRAASEYAAGRRAAYAHAAEMAREAYQSWPGVWQLDALAAELDDQPAAQAQPVAVLSALRARAKEAGK